MILLNSIPTEFHRYADIEIANAVFSLQKGGTRKNLSLVFKDRFDHSSDGRIGLQRNHAVAVTAEDEACVFSTETFRSMAMKARMRAESSTPAMPMTRSRGKRDTRRVTSHIEWVRDDDQDAVRRTLDDFARHAGDDLLVFPQQIDSAHAGLSRQTMTTTSEFSVPS